MRNTEAPCLLPAPSSYCWAQICSRSELHQSYDLVLRHKPRKNAICGEKRDAVDFSYKKPKGNLDCTAIVCIHEYKSSSSVIAVVTPVYSKHWALMGSIPVRSISTISATRTRSQMDKPTDGNMLESVCYFLKSQQLKPPDLWQTGDSHARSPLLLIWPSSTIITSN